MSRQPRLRCHRTPIHVVLEELESRYLLSSTGNSASPTEPSHLIRNSEHSAVVGEHRLLVSSDASDGSIAALSRRDRDGGDANANSENAGDSSDDDSSDNDHGNGDHQDSDEHDSDEHDGDDHDDEDDDEQDDDDNGNGGNSAAALTVDNVTAVEGMGLVFTVRLSKAVPGGTDVDVTLTDVTATGGPPPLAPPEDYDNVVATLSFTGTAGETQQFTVATLDDTVAEPSETFTVSLSSSNSAVTDTDTATGTITDNDSAPAVTVENVSAVEGTGLVFTVTLSGAVQGGTTVNVTLTDVTATGGAAPLVSPEDYDNVVAPLVFTGTAGETKQFTVATLDDTVRESSETFTVSLNAVNPAVTDTDTATGTITDNDSASVTVENVSAVEGTGLVFTVTLNGAVQGGTNVNVTLTDVTATGGAAPLVSPEDYDNVVAPLVFTGTAGETKQFTVATLNDTLPESSETFTVSLNAVNPLVTDTDTATGTITDNDTAVVGAVQSERNAVQDLTAATDAVLNNFIAGSILPHSRRRR